MKFKFRRAIYAKDIIMCLYLLDDDSSRILFGTSNSLETLIKDYSDDYNT